MIISTYDILETIGRGGMGIVYRGRHRDTGQAVAIKVMTEHAASSWVLCQRFHQEFAVANRLRHPHIVRGLEFGVQDGRPFLVMELVEGQNLGERIKEHGPLPETEALRITLQIADALQLAHQHGLVHRDVKPENILLAEDGRAMLTDLGLVKDLRTVGADLTGDGTALGTIAYVAPEQYENARNADVRCDIYSLGASLYHALTGFAPFQGATSLAILKKKLANDFPPLRRIVRSLSKRVEAAICQALDSRPQRRQGSCAEFVASLLAPSPGAEPVGTVLPDCIGGDAGAQAEPAHERRKACRFPTSLRAWCHPWHDANNNPWGAEIQDISLTGCRLELDRGFEPGSLLAVTVFDKRLNRRSHFCVEVRWARKIAARKWALGAAFQADLSARELDALLGDPPATVAIHQR